MTIRNVYYEITSFHTLMVADTHVSKGKRENTERLRFYDNREGNLEEISTLLRAGKVPKVEYHSFYVYVPKVRKVIFIDYWSKVVQRAIYDGCEKPGRQELNGIITSLMLQNSFTALTMKYLWIFAGKR